MNTLEWVVAIALGVSPWLGCVALTVLHRRALKEISAASDLVKNQEWKSLWRVTGGQDHPLVGACWFEDPTDAFAVFAAAKDEHHDATAVEYRLWLVPKNTEKTS
jgi:hypothetical protein